MPSTVYKKIFVDKWPSEVGGVLLALLNIMMFIYAGPIGATTAVIAEWGKWTYKITSLHMLIPWQVLPSSKYFPQSILYIGLMSGVFLSALVAGQFSLKREDARGYVQGFIGGALMGVGSFLSGACILGGMYSDIMSLSLNGFVMMGGLLAGAFLGGKFMMWQINRNADAMFSPECCEAGPSKKEDADKKDYRQVQRGIAMFGVVLIGAVIIVDILAGTEFPGTAFISGVLFGIVIQRSAFCFAAAFREIFMTRTTRMMRSLLLSLIIGAVGFSLIKMTGLKPSSAYVFHTASRVLIGGLIFGFGMTITGG